MDDWGGIFPPLITPLHSDESIDLASLARLVRFQIDQGVHGLWAMGTTAEFASFDEGERAAAIEVIVSEAAGRVPVIANISDASTRMAIRHGRRSASAGAQAVAATPPYYYPHSQDELLIHYRRIREAIDLPLFIYNIPQTVRVQVAQATARTLAAEGTVAGIKDSQNDLEWFRRLSVFVQEHDLSFRLFAGTRYLIDAAMLCGAHGAIPNLANAFPQLCISAYKSSKEGDVSQAQVASQQILEIEQQAELIVDGSRNAAVLGLIKTVLCRQRVIESPTVSSPLRALSAQEQEEIWRRVGSLNTSLAPESEQVPSRA